MPFLRVDGATVHYTDTEGDGPPIVFGHGLLFSGWMFTAQIAALRERYRCIAIDWRGQGGSPPADDGRYGMDVLTDDARALIGHLGVGPVHWVGLSMGGFVGQRLAARHPDLIRSLVLLDTSAAPEPRASAIQDLALAAAYRVLGMRPVRRPVVKIMFGPSFRRDPLVDEWMARLARTDRAGLVGAIRAVAGRRGVEHELAGITAPTLVAVGEHDVPTPPARSRDLVAAIPGARFEIIADSGHSSTVEQPGTVTALLQRFLEEVDA